METWYNAFKYFLIIFYEKMLSVRERNMKLLLKTVTYTAVKERVTCVITIGTVMCIINCRKYHLHNCNRNSHLHDCNRKIHQHTSNRKYYLKTCKNATDIVTCIIATGSFSCTGPTETATSRIDYRNFCRNGASLRFF